MELEREEILSAIYNTLQHGQKCKGIISDMVWVPISPGFSALIPARAA